MITPKFKENYAEVTEVYQNTAEYSYSINNWLRSIHAVFNVQRAEACSWFDS
jgi:hypothetical protein